MPTVNLHGDFLTVDVAAHEVGVTEGRLYQMIRAGDVAAERPHSRAVLIPRSEVERLKRLPRSARGRPRKSDP